MSHVSRWYVNERSGSLRGGQHVVADTRVAVDSRQQCAEILLTHRGLFDLEHVHVHVPTRVFGVGTDRGRFFLCADG